MIYCGIDASSSSTGVCIFDNEKLVFYDKFKPQNKLDFRSNTCQIIDEIIGVLQRFNPHIVYMEDIPMYAGTNGIKPLVYLGCVQGIFHREISHKLGYKIKYIPVSTWRQDLGILKGQRNRTAQKRKAVELVNETFDLDLYYVEGKTSVKDDDDIAEAICIAWSQIKKKST